MSKTRDQIAQQNITPAALEKIVSFNRPVVEEVKQALATHEWVVIGMSGNPYVKRARKLLTEKGIAFHYIEKGSYLTGWKVRLAIKLYTGWPTFPQVFHKGILVGGFDDLKKHLNA